MNRTIVTLAALGLLVGCGVPKEQLEAKALEAENYRRQYEDASNQAKAQDAKIAELTKQVQALTAQLEEANQAKAGAEEATAAAEQKVQQLEVQLAEATALNETLSRDKEKLAAAKKELEQKSQQYEQLAQSLKEEIRAGKIELSELKGRMVVKMKDKILFSSGSVKINPEGQAALAKVAEALKDVQGKIIQVEGHTDNVPTDPKGPFASNWELSTTRALAVVKLLQEKGVDPAKLSAVGYGEYHPIASNKTANGRSLNRRIEIVLAPEEHAPGVKAPRTASNK
ncbi:MAG: OmpA family protein [Myxococcaceae bacterium]|nr:OmpA family protein [Myxococcaceae bacterium]